MESLRCAACWTMPAGISAAAANSSGAMIAVGLDDGAVVVLDNRMSSPVSVLPASPKRGNAVTAIAFVGSGARPSVLVVATADSQIKATIPAGRPPGHERLNHSPLPPSSLWPLFKRMQAIDLAGVKDCAEPRHTLLHDTAIGLEPVLHAPLVVSKLRNGYAHVRFTPAIEPTSVALRGTICNRFGAGVNGVAFPVSNAEGYWCSIPRR